MKALIMNLSSEVIIHVKIKNAKTGRQKASKLRSKDNFSEILNSVLKKSSATEKTIRLARNFPQRGPVNEFGK
jgi:hypothetical protein